MINQDTISTAQAVEEVTALTTAVGDAEYSTLQRHSSAVTGCIIRAARLLTPDQQSKLIDFTQRLQRVTIPRPHDGGVLALGGGDEVEEFWSGMPMLSLHLADYHAAVPRFGTQEENDRYFENCTAFVAQLSEAGFLNWKEDLGWSYGALTSILNVNRNVRKKDMRLACIWLIYAPAKLWLNIQLNHTRKYLNVVEKFTPEHWPKWKQVLQDCQNASSEEFSDKDTQELIKRALDSMDKTEVEQNSSI
ncbi:unnamed protein product [Clonostachys byssicola]|uniref:Uncharacterized protein n=1 Tax=Clonostachys byssicola TaxID=160290 RepID=A0A9N9U3X3_9HYPO|nr:unnamed protein product [Clonostachys byssicola]